MRRFDYTEPATLAEAVALLGRHAGKASLLAGGTDLLVEIREEIRRPDLLVNIKKIAGLDGLSFDPRDGLRCGALVTARALELSPLVRRHYRSLMTAAVESASVQLRHRATIGGNVCRASPSADTLPPLMCDEAIVDLHGAAGARSMPIEEFVLGPGRTALAADELLTGLRLPAPASGTGKVYIKHGRRKAMELATVGVAVTLTLEEGRCSAARIVLGAVGPTPLRATQAEELLLGRVPTPQLVAQAARAALATARPISDVRASADYRRQMVPVLTTRALEQAVVLARLDAQPEPGASAA